MMAYVTRYIFGTDKLRPNAFEVRGLNGASTGVVHCDDAAILSQWLKYITDNIMGLTHLQVSCTHLDHRTKPAKLLEFHYNTEVFVLVLDETV